MPAPFWPPEAAGGSATAMIIDEQGKETHSQMAHWQLMDSSDGSADSGVTGTPNGDVNLGFGEMRRRKPVANGEEHGLTPSRLDVGSTSPTIQTPSPMSSSFSKLTSPSRILSAERQTLHSRLISLPEQVASLSAALQKSNENLRNCHTSLREVMLKDEQMRLHYMAPEQGQVRSATPVPSIPRGKQGESLLPSPEVKLRDDLAKRKLLAYLRSHQQKVQYLAADLKHIRQHAAGQIAEMAQDISRLGGRLVVAVAAHADAMAAANNEMEHQVLQLTQRVTLAQELSVTLVQERDAALLERSSLQDAQRSAARENEELRHQSNGLRALQEKLLVAEQALQAAQREKELALQTVQLEVAKEQEKAQAEVALWRDKFRAEMKERRRIFNQLQDLRGNVRVFCRVRPLTSEEDAMHQHSITSFPEEGQVEVMHPATGRAQAFEFDNTFGPNSEQATVFDEVEPLLTSVLDGYHVCIFAYGQTGSGKTYTMDGTAGNWGINLRTLNALFEGVAERKQDFEYSVAVSVMEIYNEQVRDLLAEPEASVRDSWNSSVSTAGPPRLEVRQGPDGVYVPGCTTVAITSLEEALAVLDRGRKNRSTGATNMNDHSSRSHCLLSVTVKGDNLVSNTRLSGKLVLVDLAGSERLSKSEATGERLKEAQHINKSLSALGDVVQALASKNRHVPYRNSTLTYLLQDSLGGDGKTLMVVQVSPAAFNATETLCSLAFAVRARGVETGPAKKHVETTSNIPKVSSENGLINGLGSPLGSEKGSESGSPRANNTPSRIPTVTKLRTPSAVKLKLAR
eukprot:jgi/Chlat1/1248/Chrsp115S01692